MAKKKTVTKKVSENVQSVPSTATGASMIAGAIVAGLAIYGDPQSVLNDPKGAVTIGGLIAGGIAAIFAMGKKKPAEPKAEDE